MRLTWHEPPSSWVSDANRLTALGTTAAGIAHDINNELTLILNHLALCDAETPQVVSMLAAMGRCSALTSSLLSYCRGEGVVSKALDLNSFVREFAKDSYLPSGVRLEVIAALEEHVAQADKHALRRVLDNLINNACHAMNEKGNIVITVANRAIRVQDSGPGIDESEREKIFEPFYSKKARGRTGVGLGLAIVRDLMSQQGGSVELVSTAGSGACFELRFRA
jgi:signal transduction histidine kinase